MRRGILGAAYGYKKETVPLGTVSKPTNYSTRNFSILLLRQNKFGKSHFHKKISPKAHQIDLNVKRSHQGPFQTNQLFN